MDKPVLEVRFPMSKILSIMSVLIPFEEKLVPIVIHNSKSETIAGIVLVAESAAVAIGQSLANLTTQPKTVS